METLGENYTVTPAPGIDVLACLPPDERRIIIAWRNARAESKNGVAFLGVIKVFREVLLFVGFPAGRVLLR